MYTLKIQGARRSTLAYHRCDSYAELRELIVACSLRFQLPIDETEQRQGAGSDQQRSAS